MNPLHRVNTTIPSKSLAARSFKPLISASQAQASPLCSPHFDRIAVFGGLHHKPIGELFYKLYEDEPVAVGSAAFKPNRRRGLIGLALENLVETGKPLFGRCFQPRRE